MKILINAPQLYQLGGVANHYLGLKDYFREDIRFNTVGSRKSLSGLLLLPYDIIVFIIKLLVFRPDVVVLNPSFAKNAIRRDSIFAAICVVLNQKFIVFIHGWDSKYEVIASNEHYKYLKYIFKALSIFILSSDFRDKLIKMGYKGKITLTTTKVDDKLIEGIAHKQIDKKDHISFLFLSRIIKEKGVFLALEAFSNLNKGDVSLSIVGDGNDLESAKEYVLKNKISKVHFLGRLDGNELTNVFTSSDVYLFPSMHGEGMPTSVLEAMAFGLPVVTTPNAGLKDFFVDGVMGFFCKFNDVSSLEEKMKLFIVDKYKISKIHTFNEKYAHDNFLASKVAIKFEENIQILINER